jgi:hypothetical protein
MEFNNRQGAGRPAGQFHVGTASLAGRVEVTGCIEDEGVKMNSDCRSEGSMDGFQRAPLEWVNRSLEGNNA